MVGKLYQRLEHLVKTKFCLNWNITKEIKIPIKQNLKSIYTVHYNSLKYILRELFNIWKYNLFRNLIKIKIDI